VRSVSCFIRRSRWTRSIETIIASAHGMPVRLLAREIDRHRVPAEVSVVPDARFVAELDGLVTLGGDGTMLSTPRPLRPG
jgi:NAD+ kinase